MHACRSTLEDPTADLEARYEKDGVEVDVMAQKDGPPTDSAINVRLSGIDEAVVDRLARDLLGWLREQAEGPLAGVVDLQDDAGTPLTELRFTADWRRLADHGIGQTQANAFVAGALDGAYVGDYWRSDGDIPLRVTITPAVARDPATLMHVPLVDDAQGRVVRFGDLGTVALATGPARLSRRDFQRSLTITGNLASDAHVGAANVVDAVERWWRAHAALYPGADVAFGGEAESTGKSYGSLIAAFFLSLFLVFALLAVQFRSYAQPLLIMSNVVFAFIGVALTLGLIGLMAMLLPDGWVRSERAMFTVQSMIAIVALTGMVVNEDIVLIDFINRRRAEGRSLREALILAGHQRLRAVLMTTLTTIAGLITMAIGLPFSIQWSPMATCFVAGLTVSSAMTLLVVPVLYELMERVLGRARRLVPRRLRHDAPP